MSYQVILRTPSSEAYIHLRTICLSPKTTEAAAKGLPNSLFSVQILTPKASLPLSPADSPKLQEVVGMGRVTGDGGCFFEVVDICVLPEHRGKGLGKLIMTEIKKWLDENVPESGFVSLLADYDAHKLYSQFDFQPYKIGIGMFMEV